MLDAANVWNPLFRQDPSQSRHRSSHCSEFQEHPQAGHCASAGIVGLSATARQMSAWNPKTEHAKLPPGSGPSLLACRSARMARFRHHETLEPENAQRLRVRRSNLNTKPNLAVGLRVLTAVTRHNLANSLRALPKQSATFIHYLEEPTSCRI